MNRLYLVSLGCARNRVDSEGMLGRLQESGWHLCDDPADAEVIVVNTCSFIDPAVEESIDTILEMAEYRKTGPCRRLIVAGCLPERFREPIAEALPEVDVFLGTGAFDQIAAAAAGSEPVFLLPDPQACRGLESPRVRTTAHMAYIKIAEGCSRHCTYCLIPRLRGKQRSRPVRDVLEEGRLLMESGVRELVLIAQDTTGYGRDLVPAAGLSDLLAGLSRMAGSRPVPPWIRFLYGHPESLSDSVIQTVARHPELCPYFDVPIQHASSRILKAMGRGYGPEALVRMAKRIRETIPEAALRTTVIVGFPGETEEDFGMLMDLAAEIRFDHLGVFIYSDAEELPSHRLRSHVPETEARQRYDRLMTAQAEISREKNQNRVGRSYPVLVEDSIQEGLYGGRTAFQAPEVDGITYIRAGSLEIGSFIRVRITGGGEYDLDGEPE